MPGYRKPKIDQAALAAKATEELKYQKSYARARLTELGKDEVTGKVPVGSAEAKRKRAAYTRVLTHEPQISVPKSGKSTLSSLAEGLRRLWNFGGKISEGAETLKALPAKMPKKKKRRK